MKNLDRQLQQAVRHFWKTRTAQARRQGGRTGERDRGARSAVTGGAQMDGFMKLVKSLLLENGVPEEAVFCNRRSEIPGYFRPEKQWDLVVVHDGHLLAGIEFKSQVGSFGNNYNNRTEEAIGNATDLWTAYREGAYKPSERPWLGYLMLLEEAVKSTTGVNVREPHYRVFDEFRGASYATRYEILLTKLLRERLYDGACFILSGKSKGAKGAYHEPSDELSFRQFIRSLLAKVIAHTKDYG